MQKSYDLLLQEEVMVTNSAEPHNSRLAFIITLILFFLIIFACNNAQVVSVFVSETRICARAKCNSRLILNDDGGAELDQEMIIINVCKIKPKKAIQSRL